MYTSQQDADECLRGLLTSLSGTLKGSSEVSNRFLWRVGGCLFRCFVVFFFKPSPRNWLTLKRVPSFCSFLRGFFFLKKSIICVVGSNIVYIHPETWGDDAIGLAHILALYSPPFCALFASNLVRIGQKIEVLKKQRIVGISSHGWYIIPWLAYHLMVGISSHGRYIISWLIVKVGGFF